MIFLKRFKRYTNNFVLMSHLNIIIQNGQIVCSVMKYDMIYKLKYFISFNNMEVDVSYYSDYFSDALVIYKIKEKPIHKISYMLYEKQIVKYDRNGNKYPWLF